MVPYFIKTFGCKVNQVESTDLSTELNDARLQQVFRAASAEIVIVNTCTVTGEADKKVRKELRRACRQDSVRTVIATGCGAVLLQAELELIDPKITVIADRNQIASHVEDLLNAGTLAVPVIPECSEERREQESLHSNESNVATNRIRVPVKVQDGCEDYCSYCIVPYARGKCRSVSASEITSKIQMLAQNGTKEVVLTGINLGNYSTAEADSIPTLLNRIKAETDIHRVRLSSIEPLHVTDDLLEILASGKLLCEHLHIPLQSGSDHVLGDMNRRYTACEYVQTVESIRAAMPHTAITTDVIVGYPSEDQADYEQTLNLVKEIGFAKTHVFRYSPRNGAPAALLRPLSPATVTHRARTLQERADMDALRYRNLRIGTQIEAIIETVNSKTNTAVGTSREYLRVELPADNLRPGDLTQLHL
ncbi:MAG: tRNA (N(6)-L-threonylcarbamoyladenosine(37)-C(2))-methylthiotransferase MtaB [Coriobacteriia bacterium]|nr:tRNA (N(6)-L-threonylcarbamoyladenosine(37)-C(2))-methylthiotransferase MtaB [Coriobacteriia bacterium]MCL2605913.1 tRNA (N(6)-L-threonylcarbamoyladenosine(37)-C(2))-methylthiotransferase MtaB [Coriobacteriia bacterium]